MPDEPLPVFSLRYRWWAKESMLSEAFMPALNVITDRLGELSDDDYADRVPGPPQLDGGPQGPQMVPVDVFFWTIMIFVGGSVSSWGMEKVWDAFLGDAVGRGLNAAKGYLGKFVGRPRHATGIERGYYKNPRDNVTLSVAVWWPDEKKYGVVRLNADRPGALDDPAPLLRQGVAMIQKALDAGAKKPCLLVQINNDTPPDRVIELDEVPPEFEPVGPDAGE